MSMHLAVRAALLFPLLITAARAGDALVKPPPLEHYAALWERSLFTTRDLPTPDSPAGPLFTDNLSLAGVYEVNGAVVAVLVDRASSNVMEARIGSENSAGIKIRQIEPGETMDKTRVQLQKGDQAGWVGFDNSQPTSPSSPQPALESRPAVPARELPPSPLLPSISGRPPSSSGDVPLPPP
ncbi:MAG TPA: hypothetical protein PK490_11690 [Prosthecobacter sp.]|nr:hypothetical protein [Prosthecobacter sp.]